MIYEIVSHKPKNIIFLYEMVICIGISTNGLFIQCSRSNWNSEVLVFVEGGKPAYPDKNPRSRDQNQNKLNPHMTPCLGIEPGPHWEACACALTTVLSLIPFKKTCSHKSQQTLSFKESCTWEPGPALTRNIIKARRFECLFDKSNRDFDWFVSMTQKCVDLNSIILLFIRSPILGGKSPWKNHCMLNLLKSPIKSIAVHVTVE